MKALHRTVKDTDSIDGYEGPHSVATTNCHTDEPGMELLVYLLGRDIYTKTNVKENNNSSVETTECRIIENKTEVKSKRIV